MREWLADILRITADRLSPKPSGKPLTIHFPEPMDCTEGGPDWRQVERWAARNQLRYSGR